MERGHDMAYFCYDNEAYMNTGIQRSSATPRFASATTTPAGYGVAWAKSRIKKDLTQIVVAHGIPLCGPDHLFGQLQGFPREGPSRPSIPKAPPLSTCSAPCPRGWQYSAELLPEICRLAVETCVWPLYEVVERRVASDLYAQKEAAGRRNL